MNADELPYLSEEYRVRFPDPDEDDPYGVVLVGGNLSVGMLLSAYEQGVFPWFEAHQPILWWNPPRRCILPRGNLHVSRRMSRFIRTTDLTYKVDTAFEEVIRACKQIVRPGQLGTWITEDMVEAYCELHRLGYAHSHEIWDADQLVGGLYGVALPHCFCGESMFTYRSNASKLALYHLYSSLMEDPLFRFIDFQVTSEHSESLGAIEVDRQEFLHLLSECLHE